MSTYYGFFHGGDPRKFWPDGECCLEKEIQDHREACRLWDEMEAKGQTPTPEACESGWHTAEDGTQYHVLKSRYGIGMYCDDEDDEPEPDGEVRP